MAEVKAIPDGFHTLTPYLNLSNAAAAIDFYKKAFGAEEIVRMPGPDGKGVMHAELKIGNSRIMMAEENPQRGVKSPKTLGGCTSAIHVYVENVDASFDRAIKAGAVAIMPPMDMFWGDRFGKLTDPFGHEWSIATHKEDLTPQEMKKKMDAFFSSGGCEEAKKS